MFRHYSTLNFPYLATKEHNLSVLLMNMLRMLRTPIWKQRVHIRKYTRLTLQTHSACSPLSGEITQYFWYQKQIWWVANETGNTDHQSTSSPTFFTDQTSFTPSDKQNQSYESGLERSRVALVQSANMVRKNTVYERNHVKYLVHGINV